jgi:DUF4097 and DUF4098 domain-containing protein YvlB
MLLLILFALTLLFLWRSLGGGVSGAQTVEDSINSGPEPRIRLVNGRGGVEIEGVNDLRSVEFEATKYALDRDEASARQSASEVPIDVSREESTFVIETEGNRNTGVDYALRVPKNSSLEVEAGAGDVRITDLEGDVTVRAEAGDVTVTGSRGSVTVEAPAGDVSLSNMRTDVGQAELDIGTGDLTLEDLVLGRIEARVRTGDVTLSDRFSGGGRIFIRTGDITSRVPREDARDLTLETRVGEVIREPLQSEGG